MAESPPQNQKYFYNPDGKISEPLFMALMEQLGHKPASKEDGLREMQRRGWLLVDATYEPVDVGYGGRSKKRDDVLLRDYPLLVAALSEMSPDKSVPIILVKANVCRVLDSRLTADGFNVINKGSTVDFPANGRQPYFRKQFPLLLKAAALRAAPCAHAYALHDATLLVDAGIGGVYSVSYA